VNIPTSTTKGDFSEPATMLFRSARRPDYDGEPVDGYVGRGMPRPRAAGAAADASRRWSAVTIEIRPMLEFRSATGSPSSDHGVAMMRTFGVG